MRRFSHEEKKIIDYICDASPLTNKVAVSELIQQNCHCSLSWENQKLSIYSNNVQSAKKAAEQILSLICLLDYLAEQGLIYLFKRNNFKDRHLVNKKEGHCDLNDMEELKEYIVHDEDSDFFMPFGKTQINGKSASFALERLVLPLDIVNKIDEYSASVFFCSETLRTIKANDYKDDATIQYEESRCQTWVGIIVAIAIGVFSILATKGLI
jgi:hypothetical protein